MTNVEFEKLLDTIRALNGDEALCVLNGVALRLADLGAAEDVMLHQVTTAARYSEFRSRLKPITQEQWETMQPQPGISEVGVAEQRNLLTGELEPPGDPNAPGWSRNTPQRVINRIRSFAPIGLDPCSNQYSTVEAQVSWEGPPHDKDGLNESWADAVASGTIVFWQPPWNHLFPWVRKAAMEWDEHEVESIGWTMHDHSTKWCQFLLSTCEAYGLWKTRENHPSGGIKSSGSKWCNTIWYYGHRAMEFQAHFHDVAHVSCERIATCKTPGLRKVWHK